MNLQWILPLAIIAAAYFTGRLFERWIIRRLKQLAEVSASRIDDVLIDSLGNTTTIWFCLFGAYAALLSYPLAPNASSFVTKLLEVAFIASGTVFIARLAVGYVNLYSLRMGQAAHSSTIFNNITRLIVSVTGILIALQTLGISITPILGALGVGGLAVALALQDTLSNLFSGLQIISSGQVKPGDFIRLDSGEEGYVVDVAWRNTTIRELANNMVIVPNAKLASSHIRNFYQPGKDLAVLVQVGVSYASDLNHVERVTIEVASEIMRTVTGGVGDFKPFIRYHTFADFSINFSVIMRGHEFVDQYLIKHEFIKRLHERYAQEGIEIPFPIRTLHIEDTELAETLVSTGRPSGRR
ncbi:MAG TPA: mechanosensitive ion channel family protein [Terriglobia bacterium]|nr:mechanosensitive ion channel family protein [Terriglobia bacterium]